MPPRNLRELVQPRAMIALSVPFGIVIANVTFPLKPIVQQALIGVTLIWFFVVMMNGFGF
jgi:hypothetical protein